MSLAKSAFHLFIFSLLTTPMAFSQSPDGTVIGTVLDEQNRPITDARVCIVVGERYSNFSKCEQTDRTGQFQIRNLPIKNHYVTASKDEDGYPEYNERNVFPTATLTAEQRLVQVVVKLGPHTGVLLPLVKDKVTGERLFDFIVEWKIDDPESSGFAVLYKAGEGAFSQWTTSTCVPARKALHLEVSWWGYRKWVYSDGATTHLRVQPGEKKVINVELEPVPGSAHRPR